VRMLLKLFQALLGDSRVVDVTQEGCMRDEMISLIDRYLSDLGMVAISSASNTAVVLLCISITTSN